MTVKVWIFIYVNKQNGTKTNICKRRSTPKENSKVEKVCIIRGPVVRVRPVAVGIARARIRVSVRIRARSIHRGVQRDPKAAASWPSRPLCWCDHTAHCTATPTHLRAFRNNAMAHSLARPRGMYYTHTARPVCLSFRRPCLARHQAWRRCVMPQLRGWGARCVLFYGHFFARQTSTTINKVAKKIGHFGKSKQSDCYQVEKIAGRGEGRGWCRVRERGKESGKSRAVRRRWAPPDAASGTSVQLARRSSAARTHAYTLPPPQSGFFTSVANLSSLAQRTAHLYRSEAKRSGRGELRHQTWAIREHDSDRSTRVDRECGLECLFWRVSRSDCHALRAVWCGNGAARVTPFDSARRGKTVVVAMSRRSVIDRRSARGDPKPVRECLLWPRARRIVFVFALSPFVCLFVFGWSLFFFSILFTFLFLAVLSFAFSRTQQQARISCFFVTHWSGVQLSLAHRARVASDVREEDAARGYARLLSSHQPLTRTTFGG